MSGTYRNCSRGAAACTLLRHCDSVRCPQLAAGIWGTDGQRILRNPLIARQFQSNEAMRRLGPYPVSMPSARKITQSDGRRSPETP